MRLRIKLKNSMYARRDRYSSACNIPEFNIYEGEIYPRPKWVKDTEFCFTTDNPNNPWRILQKEDIVHGWILPSDPEAVSNVTLYKVKGKKSTHVVTDSRGKWSCDCIGYGYRRQCNHIAAAKNSA